MPPVKAFWSLTMYDPDIIFVPNPIDRYSLSQRGRPGCSRDQDGGLTIHVQAESPGRGGRGELATLSRQR